MLHMADKRNYVLQENGKDTKHVFKGRSPRQAALKAATRGFTDIKLRERGRRNTDGSHSIHIFKGRKEKVDKPETAPAWMSDTFNKPFVEKTGVKHI